MKRWKVVATASIAESLAVLFGGMLIGGVTCSVLLLQQLLGV